MCHLSPVIHIHQHTTRATCRQSFTYINIPHVPLVTSHSHTLTHHMCHLSPVITILDTHYIHQHTTCATCRQSLQYWTHITYINIPHVPLVASHSHTSTHHMCHLSPVIHIHQHTTCATCHQSLQYWTHITYINTPHVPLVASHYNTGHTLHTSTYHMCHLSPVITILDTHYIHQHTTCATCRQSLQYWTHIIYINIPHVPLVASHYNTAVDFISLLAGRLYTVTLEFNRLVCNIGQQDYVYCYQK